MNLVPWPTRCDKLHTTPEYPLTTHSNSTIAAQLLAEDVGRTDVDSQQPHNCYPSTVVNTNWLKREHDQMTSNWLVKTRLLTFIFSTSLLVACGGGGGGGGGSTTGGGGGGGGGGGEVVARTTVSQVATPLDDVEEQPDGSMYTTSSDLELIDASGAEQIVGMRFVVSVPQNATITNAYIQFTVDETASAATNLQITAEASADAAAFSSSNNDVSSRPTTSASVLWSPPAWNTIGDATVAQRTPDLSSVVQEVVDISGWDLDNHIVLMITGTGGRTAVSRDNSTTQAPKLYVEYEVAKSAGGETGSGNNAPTISGTPASNVAQDTTYTFTPTAADSDVGDTLTFSVSNPPSWASFSTATGVLSGVPTSGDIGTSSNIVISVSDGTDTASLPAFSVTVTSDTPPVAVDDSVVGTEDNTSVIAVLNNDTDADGDTLSIASITQPANGDTAITGTNVTYSPNSNFYGTDTFTYTADDGLGGTDTATVTVTVNPVNDTPVAQPDNASTTQGNTVTMALLSNDTGLGDGSIVVTITSSTVAGALTNNNDGTVSYTPNAGFTGNDSFMYQITDADGQTSTANGSIAVTCPGVCTGDPKTIRVTWTANSESDVVGYYLYHGTTSGNYTDAIWAGNMLTHDFVTSVLGSHFIAITAVTADGAESAYSDEVSLNLF